MEPHTPRLANQRWVAEQYKTPRNLNARIQLHKRFSSNPHPWLHWVFEQLHLAPDMRVLEIGGGPGGLWQENRQHVPAKVKITFTDQSTGMIAQALSTLGDLRQFTFGVVDAQALPFASRSSDSGSSDNGLFDRVIANHMLYHVPDRNLALAEIRRVLKPTGRFFAATNDRTHMQELRDLAETFLPGSSQLASINERFSFDVATQELSQHFGQIQLHRYQNNLVVTDADLLADYMLSGLLKIPVVAEAPFRRWLHNRMLSEGAITVTSASGLFEAASAA